MQNLTVNLIVLDYPVCAVAEGKKNPILPDWQNNPLKKEDAEKGYTIVLKDGNPVAYDIKNCSAGIICGIGEHPVYGLDFDIPQDAAFAKAVREDLMDIAGLFATMRVGQAPKFLVPVTSEPGLTKTTTAFYVNPNFVDESGKPVRARFEFLGKGQQFVACGVHERTKKPYEWQALGDCSPEKIPAAKDLPVITPEDIERCKAIFAEKAALFGWKPEGEVPQSSGDFQEASDAELTPNRPLENVSLSDVRQWLFALDKTVADPRDKWIEIGMMLHHQFNGDVAAMCLWDEWSQQSPKYTPGCCEKEWATFHDDHSHPLKTIKTLRWLYFQTEWGRFEQRSKEFTQKGRAARMYIVNRGTLALSPLSQVWRGWDGRHWKVLPEVAVEAKADEILGWRFREDIEKGDYDEETRKIGLKLLARWQTAKEAKQLVLAAAQLPPFWVDDEKFDADPNIFGVGNGDINLTTGEFLRPDSTRCVATFTDICYDVGARCPRWEKALLDCFEGDHKKVAYIQRICGYAMLGKPRLDALFIFVGGGQNGKTTVLNVIKRIFGQHGDTMSLDTLFDAGSTNRGGGTRGDLVKLKGKRLASASESNDGAKLTGATLKQLTSLDGVSARGPYMKVPITFTPTWVTFLTTNFRPEIRDMDDGTWRRIHFVEFKHAFKGDDCDTKLAEKLEPEMSGILNWCIAGAVEINRRISAGGDADKVLEEPEEFLQAKNSYRLEQDLVGQWLDDRCILDAEAETPVLDAYSSFRSWMDRNGRTESRTQTWLTRQLSGKNINWRKTRRKAGNDYIGIRMYQGIRLRDDELAPPSAKDEIEDLF